MCYISLFYGIFVLHCPDFSNIIKWSFMGLLYIDKYLETRQPLAYLTLALKQTILLLYTCHV